MTTKSLWLLLFLVCYAGSCFILRQKGIFRPGHEHAHPNGDTRKSAHLAAAAESQSIPEHFPYICLQQFKPVVPSVKAQAGSSQNLLICAKRLSFNGYETLGLPFESSAAKS